MSCDNYDNAYYGACRPDVPYPSTSAESVPSLINNKLFMGFMEAHTAFKSQLLMEE
jgi:hypothetical protein